MFVFLFCILSFNSVTTFEVRTATYTKVVDAGQVPDVTMTGPDCQLACLDNTQCEGFFYNETMNTCMLYNQQENSTVTPKAVWVKEKSCDGNLPIEWRGHCYGSFSSAVTQQQAEAVCKDNDGDLLWITDDEEQTFITNTLATQDGLKWIGCVYTAGQFVWTHTNQPLGYTNWAQGDPNNMGVELCCAFDYPTLGLGRWVNCMCDLTARFVCKRLM